MDFVKMLSGNTTPTIMDYQIGENMANVGVPVLVGGAGEEGVVLASTTAAADLVGITMDAPGDIVTAQQSDNSDPAREVRVCISPDAVYKARLSGGATEGTALTLFDVSSASTDGLTITTGDAWDSPTYDEGVAFGWDGANSGIGRKITSVSSSAATLTVALPHDTVVGDNFIRVPFCASPFGMEDQFVQLSTNLTEVDASFAVDTDNANFRVVELLLYDKANDPDRLLNLVHIVPFDSIFAAGGSV